jgi:hypothetical protein
VSALELDDSDASAADAIVERSAGDLLERATTLVRANVAAHLLACDVRTVLRHHDYAVVAGSKPPVIDLQIVLDRFRLVEGAGDATENESPDLIRYYGSRPAHQSTTALRPASGEKLRATQAEGESAPATHTRATGRECDRVRPKTRGMAPQTAETVKDLLDPDLPLDLLKRVSRRFGELEEEATRHLTCARLEAAGGLRCIAAAHLAAAERAERSLTVLQAYYEGLPSRVAPRAARARIDWLTPNPWIRSVKCYTPEALAPNLRGLDVSEGASKRLRALWPLCRAGCWALAQHADGEDVRRLDEREANSQARLLLADAHAHYRGESSDLAGLPTRMAARFEGDWWMGTPSASDRAA